MNTVQNNKTWCVIIPTYNNAKTLKRVIDGVLNYTNHIFIVNDGSTDKTADILKNYQQLYILNVPQNKGKGNALQVGFRKALALNYDYGLTIDSDGQHYPSDIPVFLEELNAATEPILLIGSRNMTHESVPKKSSFGNRFSNFWFQFETGIKLTDTQSGYRLYPLKHLPKRFFTKKFEFEIEVIVRTAWKNILVKNVPIQVLYDPNERVSHFRPFRDFTRISILNTVLVLITLLYIKPRNILLKFKKKSFKAFLKEDILQTNDTNEVKALSLALGVFIGIVPVWGFQTFLSIFLAAIFKLNKTISFVGSNISLPPFIPFIVLASLKVGSFFVGESGEILIDFDNISFDSIKNHLLQYIVGSTILATFMAVLLGFICYIILNFYNRKATA
ncbi:Glycosyltransferase involved in cell wall bisynthesis [Paenimyroides ummariense]|uniref:Glycosyltransferase involved in cell wall bisynthesis n=1 Tax=Paenimyroides ummariense TaxID=913024 RepID=A0A1I4WZR0_9FLAO|nr:DUF2062 domain-containing protein [Paenimyroides ummariense]SFN19211.1 Glycosyltransferase involved in cell wall bisynthesis [Paenimyroides ummariense]